LPAACRGALVDELGVGLADVPARAARRVAHHRFDQRAGGVGIHVPQRFLHAQREDVGVALQGFVRASRAPTALLHADQEVAADQGRHRRPPNTTSSSAP
jgi:hypothetical protein